MARIFPSDITRLELSGAHRPELDTLRMLRDELPGDYEVYHGVHWSREYAKKTAFGEIDFVVVNRSGEVMLIEQKNGALVEQDGKLTKVYADADKDVIGQIRRSVDNVKAKFRQQNRREPTLETHHLVYCPDHRMRNLNAVGIGADRIVDASAADGLAGRIQSVLGSGVVDRRRADLVRGFFRQTLNLVVDIHAYIEKQDRYGTPIQRPASPRRDPSRRRSGQLPARHLPDVALLRHDTCDSSTRCRSSPKSGERHLVRLQLTALRHVPNALRHVNEGLVPT